MEENKNVLLEIAIENGNTVLKVRKDREGFEALIEKMAHLLMQDIENPNSPRAFIDAVITSLLFAMKYSDKVSEHVVVCMEQFFASFEDQSESDAHIENIINIFKNNQGA